MIFKSIFIIFTSLINFCVLKDNFVFNATLSDDINERLHSTAVESLQDSLKNHLITGTEEEFWNNIRNIFEIFEKHAKNIDMTSNSKDNNKAVGKNLNKELNELNLPSGMISTGFRAFMNKRSLSSFESNNILPKRFLTEPEVPQYRVVNNCTYVNSTYNECNITFFTGCEFLLQCYKPSTSTFFVNTMNNFYSNDPVNWFVSCYMEHGCPAYGHSGYDVVEFLNLWADNQTLASEYIDICYYDPDNYPIPIAPQDQYLYKTECNLS